MLDDMRIERVSHWTELSDYDFKVFASEHEANTWSERFLRVLKNLNNSKICEARDLPALLIKRSYMIQTILGEKLQTYRTYKKNWKPGQKFNLHDQVYFLTVTLTQITYDTKRELYRYDFSIDSERLLSTLL